MLPDYEFENRIASRLLDVLIRAALIGVMAALCYVVFAPFLTLMVWALILEVMLYQLYGSLRARSAETGLAATLVVVIGGLLIVTPLRY
jgi:predicted PurR-regulated permease PerM